MSCLPLAQNLIEIQRSMTTSSTAIFVAVYHPGTVSDRERGSVLWVECPVQQPDHG